MHSLRSRIAIATLTMCFLTSPVRAEKPTRAEIAQRGKAATAFVQVPGRGTGTAFCIHPSGLLVTNEHVVRGRENAEITLILDASLATEQSLTAKIVRADKELDLALLRVDGEREFPSLPLGSLEGVTELAEVIAFGFPLGTVLSANRKDYPAISVNAGHVSALRRRDTELDRIQIDVSVTFGNSGGPVLDENGEVIGMVVSGIGRQRGINLAIPVSHISRFLETPDIQFTPPELTRAVLDKPAEFKARVVSVLPGRKEPTLRLILRAGDEEARELPMTATDGVHVAKAIPVLQADSGRVDVSVRFGTGMVSGVTEDVILKVGGAPVKLSGIRRIVLKPKPAVHLADGSTMESEAEGLGPVEIAVGDENLTLDLRKAAQIHVQPAAEIGLVMASIVASIDGQDLRRIDIPIPVRDAGQLPPVDPSSVAITPPPLADNTVVKPLPEPFADLCLGGGGRFFIFHLPRLRRLAVFDINEARITNYIPLAEDKVAFTAGLEKLVIGLPAKGILERWSLTTFDREATVFPPLMEEIQTMAMGHASVGPVVVNGMFLDLGSLQPLPITERARAWEPHFNVYPSADGTVFARWGDESVSYAVENNEIKGSRARGLGHLLPGPDGRMIFTAEGVVTNQLMHRTADDAKLGYCIPAVRGNYFLSLSPGDGNQGGGVTVHLPGYSRPLARPDHVTHGLRFDRRDREGLGAWRRVFFIPQADLIAVLPAGNDRIVLYKFDVDAALEASGLDYLLVTSQPPRTVLAGETFKYAIEVKAKHGPISFNLETGPQKMEVSQDGVVTWKVPADSPTAEQDAILTVRDGLGQEVFHTLAVRVVR